MSERVRISRREFLSLSAALAAGSMLAACAPATPEPSSPATVAPTVALPTATTADATAVPTAVPPTAVPPTAVPPTAEPGKLALGKLEGPVVILDKAQYPKTFKEAPMLAELVKAGKLPPVEQRLPEDPLVIKPLHEIGTYGGTWRSGFTGAGDRYNAVRLCADDRILYWNYEMNEVIPSVAGGWEVSADGTTTTVFLRKGLKWSDGQPFTADDVMFWYEDIYLNKDLIATPSANMAVGGEQGKMEKVDDYTVRYVFSAAYYMFPEILAGWNSLTGHAAWGFNGNGGGIAPKHYLEQFHPDYADKAALDKAVADGKFDTWMKLFTDRNSWPNNPDLPTLTPWKTVQPVNTPNWLLERNPYYFGVDSEGNQLPYIDYISLTLAENVEVLNLRAIAGEYDFQSRHVDIQKLPVYIENQEQGDYKVYLDPADNGANACINFIQSYDADPEIAKWITDADFRRALSQGIDRDQINEAFFLGLGTPGSVVPAPNNAYYPGDDYRTKYHTLNVKAANDLLDSIGLSNKDAQGYRLRTDGKGRLVLEFLCVSGQFVDFVRVVEMIRGQLAEIGLEVVPKEVDRTLASTMMSANEVPIYLWDNGGTDVLFGAIDNLIMWFGAPYRTWLSRQGVPPEPAPTPVPFMEPPDVIKEFWADWGRGLGVPDEERVEIGKSLWKTIVDNCFQVGLVGLSPATGGVRIAKNNMGNMPERMISNVTVLNPMQSRPSTYYFKP